MYLIIPTVFVRILFLYCHPYFILQFYAIIVFILVIVHFLVAFEACSIVLQSRKSFILCFKYSVMQGCSLSIATLALSLATSTISDSDAATRIDKHTKGHRYLHKLMRASKKQQ